MDARATLFHAYLDQHDQRAWDEALARLLPAIHEVDRAATEIWFHFYPLVIARALRGHDDRAFILRRLWLQGRPDIADHFDTSQVFLLRKFRQEHNLLGASAAATTSGYFRCVGRHRR